jgi:hypothetical protein
MAQLGKYRTIDRKILPSISGRGRDIVVNLLQLLFGFHGRISRKQFWYPLIINRFTAMR